MTEVDLVDVVVHVWFLLCFSVTGEATPTGISREIIDPFNFPFVAWRLEAAIYLQKHVP